MQIETDLYVAIDRATDRAGRTVIRKIKRQQSLLRQGRPPLTDTTLLDQITHYTEDIIHE